MRARSTRPVQPVEPARLRAHGAPRLETAREVARLIGALPDEIVLTREHRVEQSGDLRSGGTSGARRARRDLRVEHPSVRDQCRTWSGEDSRCHDPADRDGVVEARLFSSPPKATRRSCH